MGEIRKRGGRYWIRYYRNGRRFEESAKTDKWETARDLLRDREGDIAKGVPISPKIGRLRFEDASKDLLTDCARRTVILLNNLRSTNEVTRIAPRLLPSVSDEDPPDQTAHELSHSCGFYWSICFRMNARRSFLSSDRGGAGGQAFAEAFARDAGIQRTHRSHTRNSPIVRAGPRHRSRFAHRSRDNRSRDTAAFRDSCGLGRHRHSHRRLEQPTGRLPRREIPCILRPRCPFFRASRRPSEVPPRQRRSRLQRSRKLSFTRAEPNSGRFLALVY